MRAQANRRPAPLTKAAGDGYTGAERSVSRIINSGWDIMDTGLMQDRAMQMLEASSAEGFLNALPWTQFAEHLGQTIEPISGAVGKAISQELGTIGHAGAKLSLTSIDALSHKYAQEQAGQLIRNISDSQRNTIRGILANAQAGNYTVDQAAREIRKGIGLHPAWATAVTNYENRLNAQPAPKGYSAARWQTVVDKRVDRYREQLIRKRSYNIARTEIITAENLGRYATWTQAIGTGAADVNSRKEWAPGPGACRLCESLAGEIVAWDAPFSNGAIMPPAHPSCRCSANLLPPEYTTPGLNPRNINWTDPAGDRAVIDETGYSAGRGILDTMSAEPAAADAADEFNDGGSSDGADTYGEDSSPADSPDATAPAPEVTAAPEAPQMSAYERDLQAMQQAATATKADQLTYESTLHWSEDKLMAQITKYEDDPEAIDKIFEIIDQRAVIEDAKIAAQEMAQASYNAEQAAKLEAEVQREAGTLKTEESPALNPAVRPERKLSPWDWASEEYQNYVYNQYSAALDETNGTFFNAANHAEAKRRGIDEINLFSGPYQTAQKYASEELKAFWQQQGRETLASFRYKLLGRETDRKAAESVARQGLGRKAASYDRSNL